MSSHLLQLPPIPSAYEQALPSSYIQSLDGLSVGIIGAGMVGSSLAIACDRHGYLKWMVVRNNLNAQRVHSTFESVKIYKSIEEIATLADILFICSTDRAITEISESLAQHFGLALNGVIVVHCSGALSSSVLQACKDQGARVVAAHPFQTFTHVHERLLMGISWGIECEASDEAYISNFIRTIGGVPMILSENTRQHKEVYHITAVVASNYLQTVIASARDAAHAAEIAPTVFLKPIIQTAVETAMMSLANNGAPPLTGPIARGDVQTIERHLKALVPYPSLLRQYCYFGLATNEFAWDQNYIDDAAFDSIKTLLEDALTPTIG